MTGIILLTGPSSSGKSSIARALLDALGGRTVWIEADRCFPLMPSPRAATLAEVALAFHRSVLAWPAAGFRLILDGSLPYDDRLARRDCIALLREHHLLLLVGVKANAATLASRELQRSDRVQGRAGQQLADIHDDLKLDCVVDSSAQSSESCAKKIISHMSAESVFLGGEPSDPGS